MAATKKKTGSGSDGLDFEKALSELERLVEKMEQGDLPLDETLKSFERGIALSQTCQKALDTAEQRVRVLTEKSGELVPESFEPDRVD